ncbi:MAG: isoleucine--tRNA ligase [Jatrophihabitantaceae bacterium]
MAYQPLPAHVDLASMDRDVLAFWAEAKVFQRSMDQTAHGPSYLFYEGPPTANGMPGTHHIEARVFKDLFPRYRTMKGYHVPRMAGWDCHGLPVELAVEKELGFTGKADIERYGIAEFNDRCRKSVRRHVDQFTELSERIGYWCDYDNAYWTMNSSYVESVWWALKRIFDADLLVEDYRVAPYCPRCGTGLSDHEVAQGYETVVDPSVYVRFPVTSGEWAGKADLLVWTTTPWTLVSNTAVAVNPSVSYLVTSSEHGTLVVAEPLAERVLGSDYQVLRTYSGTELERWRYQRPFELVQIGDAEQPAHYIVLADYVTTEDGTGLVHQSPAFGAEDLAVCRAYGLPVVNPISKDGHFLPELALVGGAFFKDADEALVADLKQRGLLFKHVAYEHAYPHCWRCHTPLMYYALPSWYIRTTARKQELLAQNEATNWYPETIKHGRYGDWLTNNIDWALSRDRYWGTPLPIWRNDVEPQRLVCVGSLAELSELTGTDQSGLDPHRPYVDAPTFTLPDVPGTFRRVPQVIDAWFDSGSMPFAQFGAPHRNAELALASYPADFICEAIDQTRGWFYTLMAIGTLVFDQSSYRNVLCLGHIVAEDGRKMSKHLGNILEPMPLLEQHGADAVRWFMAAAGSPWSQRRIGHKLLEEIASKVLRTYWSLASFQSLYARANDWSPDSETAGSSGEPSVLDRWALAETARVAGEVDAALQDYDTARGGRALAGLIDDLSNWYVRRSRRRFWDGDPAALRTLHDCLHTLTRLLAPYVPFVTEAVWLALFAESSGVESVHLASWPAVQAPAEPRLAEQVALVRRLVELGRAARAASKVKTRQPLARALISAAGWAQLPPELRAEVADELNVVELAELASSADLVDVTVKPNFRALGKRFGPRTKQVADAIVAADHSAVAASVRARGSFELGEFGEIAADELVVSEVPVSGWAVESGGQDTVALDLELTPELRRLGTLRDIVRIVQEARKGAGYEVTDRIELHWLVGGSPEPAEAIREHAEELGREVLAGSLSEGAPAQPDGFDRAGDEELGLQLWLRRIAG